MKKTICTIAIIALTFVTNAQQQSQFTQYMDNMQYYNPAYVGSRGMLNIVGLHRQQWAGFKGAPMSSSFSLNAPLRNNLGLGFSVLNDAIGPTNTTWLNADFSYSLKFRKNKSRLSFGVKGGVSVINGDIDALLVQDPNDEVLNVAYSGQVTPNFGAGIYYSSEQWFAGLACPAFMTSPNVNLIEDYDEIQHYYFMTGGYIPLNRMLKLRPSTMIKVTPGAPLSLDLNLATIFYDKLWIGANYRILESVGVYAQYQLSNDFKLGYSFELSTNALRSFGAGSHEIMLSYDLMQKGASIYNPRYF